MKRAIVGISSLVLLVGCATQSHNLAPTAQPKAPRNIVIDFGGDTNGVEHISSYLNKGGDPFAAVAAELRSADLAVINLETAVTTQKKHQEKEYVFSSNPLLLTKAKAAGIDVVNLGNNHAGDYLRLGVTETINAAHNAGLEVIGAGNSGADAWSAKIFDIRGTKIALLGIAKVNGGVGTVASGSYAGTTDGWNSKTIEAAIKAALTQAKTVIIYVHWGAEAQACAAKADIADAQKWLSYGASVIIGSHSHRQQPIVQYGSKFVDYSLGNFAFYVRSGDGLDSGLGQLTLTPSGEVLSYTFKPATIDPITGAPSLLTGSAAQSAIAKKQSGCSTS